MQTILKFSQYLQQIVCFISVEFCGTSFLAFNTVSLFISIQQVEKDSTFVFCQISWGQNAYLQIWMKWVNQAGKEVSILMQVVVEVKNEI